ncbi:MAG: serine/threonine-protein kinase [Mycobacteriales bacterium]|nr:serine/threonine-protein kinase [Mycobacteriales bacterium]
MQEVPGYDVMELLATGGAARVHRAVHRVTGEVVALKWLLPGVDPDLLQREAEALARVSSPYVVRLRGVLLDDTVLVLDHAVGGTLGRLLSRRGTLDPGEVVTVLVPVALGLAAAHATGLVHGDVSPATVLLTADGMPLLADLGAAKAPGEQRPVDATPGCLAGAPVTPASDVWALGVLGLRLLGLPLPDPAPLPSSGPAASPASPASDAPPALLAALSAAVHPDSAARPTATSLARTLQQSCTPLPLRAAGGPLTVPAVVPAVDPDAAPLIRPVVAASWSARSEEPVTRPVAVPLRDRGARVLSDPLRTSRFRSRVPGRRGLVVGAALTLVVLAAGAGWAWGRAAGTPSITALPVAVPPVAVSPTATRLVTWTAVLDSLDRARSEAFAQAATDGLTSVWAPGSAGLAADTAAVRRLADAGRVATGLRHRVIELEVRQQSPDRVALRTVDVLAPHEVRTIGGTVLEQVGERPAASYDVVLVKSSGRWLLASVAPA